MRYLTVCLASLGAISVYILSTLYPSVSMRSHLEPSDNVDVSQYKVSLPVLKNDEIETLKFSSDNAEEGFIIDNRVNVYDSPNDEGNIIGELNYADYVINLSGSEGKTCGWICIKYNDLKGYIHNSSLTTNFIMIKEEKDVFTDKETYAYSSPSDTVPLFEISFNSKIKQLFYNGQWAICEVNGVQYYIRSDKLSSSKHFVEEEKVMYISNAQSVILTSSEEDPDAVPVLEAEQEIMVNKYNEDFSEIQVNNETYIVNTDSLVPYRTLSEVDLIGTPCNENYDNLAVLNRLNSMYNGSIAKDFYINNDGVRNLVQRYIDEATLQARPGASPAEIAYYGYLALMENATYHYNTYAYMVAGAYDGLCDNSGSYRTASILDPNIGLGACENYAAAMTAMLRSLGFDAEIVGGNGGGSGSYGHYWCQVGNLVFDAQIDDSNNTYGLRFGRTSSELIEMGSSGYYVEETSNNSAIVELYNQFN